VRTLNLGILAHVDAGKTTLTERLLYAAGVIDQVGSVDHGTTQTDSLPLERRRGITIKSAVVSFVIDGVTVNLIDTPGHPDFIAEVERVLGILDGVVLVISAVEGVQPQTRVLMRALQRLRVPTLLFVNKIDRGGADDRRVVRQIAEWLTPAGIEMGMPDHLGSGRAGFTPYGEGDRGFRVRLAELLADHDDSLLAAYVDDVATLSYERLRGALAAHTAEAHVHPVFFGSAVTGAGTGALMAGVVELLPTTDRDTDGPPAGIVFKVERTVAGEKLAYVRLFDGTLRTRDRVPIGAAARTVTSIDVFDGGHTERRRVVGAGQIARLGGLGDVRIGDAIGAPPSRADGHQFTPPTLETVVAPRDPDDVGRLHAALSELAEQDPLINLRQDDGRHELFVSLYGEVQKEVIEATLADDYGLTVEFRDTTTICIERPAGPGAAVELLGGVDNPFLATVGFRVDPARPGGGLDVELDVAHDAVPVYLYKSVPEFAAAVQRTVRETLTQGLRGWSVTDGAVTMTDSGYQSPETTTADFRRLIPLVVMTALARAGTVVCEPVQRLRLETPTDTLGPVLAALARLQGVPDGPVTRGRVCTVEGQIPASQVHALQRQLPALSRGEGVLETTFAGYRPVQGTVPARPRTDANPLNRQEYLLHLSRRL